MNQEVAFEQSLVTGKSQISPGDTGEESVDQYLGKLTDVTGGEVNQGERIPLALDEEDITGGWGIAEDERPRAAVRGIESP